MVEQRIKRESSEEEKKKKKILLSECEVKEERKGKNKKENFSEKATCNPQKTNRKAFNFVGCLK